LTPALIEGSITAFPAMTFEIQWLMLLPDRKGLGA